MKNYNITSLEVARQLKNLNFEGASFHYYLLNTIFFTESGPYKFEFDEYENVLHYRTKNSSGQRQLALAPSIDVALNWLENTYNLIILPVLNTFNGNFGFEIYTKRGAEFECEDIYKSSTIYTSKYIALNKGILIACELINEEFQIYK